MLVSVRRPAARVVTQRRRHTPASGAPDDGKRCQSLQSQPCFTIDDRGHQVWASRSADQPKRVVQLRFAYVPESMVDALSAIREVERKFGRIRDYRPLRDADLPSEYQAIFWAAFESPESFKLVPSSGATLKVPVSVRESQEGGPGLSDILGLLEPRERGRLDRPAATFSGDLGREKSGETVRTIDVEVRRVTETEIRYRNTTRPPIRSRAMKAAIGHAFLDWGGFASLQPLYETSPFADPTQAHKEPGMNHMRLVLNKWSQILDRPDPSFPEMQAKREEAVREPSSSNDFFDAVTRTIASSSAKLTRQLAQKPFADIVKPTSTRPKDGWEPVKDFKVKSRQRSPRIPSIDISEAPKPPKERTLERARHLVREQGRDRLIQLKSESRSHPSFDGLKENLESVLESSEGQAKQSDVSNEKGASPVGRDEGGTEESKKKGFWNWF
ncbi:hypothetical protein EDD16DRAFT_1710048 [Pisolithus croceorrhizus]|nr:hypothetical protein EDD16DRAFT_1710048 [Pisolithus croceorrhizus]KAI6125475.1 hypothetical protein EV401DRAFT_2068228 [Pisolithus croceorrhizus]